MTARRSIYPDAERVAPPSRLWRVRMTTGAAVITIEGIGERNRQKSAGLIEDIRKAMGGEHV